MTNNWSEHEKTVSVVLAIGDNLTRELMTNALASMPGLDILGSAANESDACLLVAQESPDVMLLDHDLPGESTGFELGQELRTKQPGIAILLFTDVRGARNLSRIALTAGAGWGVLVKGSIAGVEDLARVINSVASGMTIIDSAMSQFSEIENSIAELTTRQFHVLNLVARGLNNEAIADELGLSLRTVEYHLNEIYKKHGESSGPPLNRRVSVALAFIAMSDGPPGMWGGGITGELDYALSRYRASLGELGSIASRRPRSQIELQKSRLN